MAQLKLLSDNSEVVPYNFRDFPVYARNERLSHYPNLACVNHWHADFEFIVVLKGDMIYSVNGREYALEQGKGIFANSRQMHYSRSRDGSDCEYLCVVFQPCLLYASQQIRDKYLEPMCSDAARPFLLLRPTVDWQRRTIENLHALSALLEEKTDGFEIKVLGVLFDLCFDLYQHVQSREDGEPPPLPDKHMEILRDMIGFIQNRYADRISLGDIAAAGSVSKSGCSNIFSRILHVSPISYLTDYRIEKSIELLSTTAQSITEIGLMCGFCSPSYYSECFRGQMGCTPSQYRRKYQ